MRSSPRWMFWSIVTLPICRMPCARSAATGETVRVTNAEEIELSLSSLVLLQFVSLLWCLASFVTYVLCYYISQNHHHQVPMLRLFLLHQKKAAMHQYVHYV